MTLTCHPPSPPPPTPAGHKKTWTPEPFWRGRRVIKWREGRKKLCLVPKIWGEGEKKENISPSYMLPLLLKVLCCPTAGLWAALFRGSSSTTSAAKGVLPPCSLHPLRSCSSYIWRVFWGLWEALEDHFWWPIFSPLRRKICTGLVYFGDSEHLMTGNFILMSHTHFRWDQELFKFATKFSTQPIKNKIKWNLNIHL